MAIAPEILAPAGSPEAFLAALQAGANAVYLGLKDFNARGNAINFTVDELKVLVPIAHQRAMKVYLTLNTLVKMNEQSALIAQLARAADAGIDGVILQDLGLSAVIAKHFPELRRHGSTQLAIHNLPGVAFCVDHGLERIVLARELTLAEIREIRAAFPPEVIELEVFCHGAMCFTYSGMCLFSGSVGGRSGNRGECAYTCRKGYRILNQTRFPMAPFPERYDNYLFSMKDMNTLDLLPQLQQAGVDSLKIEGRRKGPAYVGASVRAYKRGLAGKLAGHLDDDLRLAFGRDYTKAFYQRGQFGDNPVDITATGSQGIHIGTVDGQNSFMLQKPGIQRYDGIRLIYPDRKEHHMAFKGYRVDQGDRHHPPKGARIFLKEKVPEGTKIMWVQSQEVAAKYKQEQSKVQALAYKPRFDMDVALNPNQLTVTLTCQAYCVQQTLSCEPSKSGKDLRLKDLLFRDGDSDFAIGHYRGPEKAPIFIPLSHVKKLRRDLLEKLSKQVVQGQTNRIQALTRITAPAFEAHAAKATRNPSEQTESHFVLRVDRLELLQGLVDYVQGQQLGLDLVLRPTLSTPQWRQILSILADLKVPLRLVWPMVLRKWDLRVLKARMPDLKQIQADWVLSNPGHFAMLSTELKQDRMLHADFALYHLNHWAVEALQQQGIDGRFTLSLEDDRPNMEALLKATEARRFEAIAYTDTPLFVAEACSLAALYGGCPGAKVCGHETLQIENEHGDRFQVRHDRCRSTVIGDKALSWSGHLDWFRARGVCNFRMDFTIRDYTPDQAIAIAENIRANRVLEETHTENLDRILL